MGEEPETAIRARCDAGDHAHAAALVVEHYGGGILALLGSRLGAADADEVFGAFCEKLCVGLPGFEWRCSAKGWAYMLARNAERDFRKAVHNRGARRTNLSAHPSVLAAAEQVRTTTQNYRRTDARSRIRALRDRLSPDDQMLLILRVDQSMGFRDLAVALAQEGPPANDAALTREAARLRKRFERVKAQLRELAEQEGLL